MSTKLKASLPGIFSIAFLVVFLLTQFFAGLPFEITDYASVILLGIAGLLGIAWVPPKLEAQVGDQSFKGNIAPLMTLVVLGLQVGDQVSSTITPAWPQYVGDVFGLIAVWLGLPWTKPQLPAQTPVFLVLWMAGAVFIAGPFGAVLIA
jgi:hypothetical protein